MNRKQIVEETQEIAQQFLQTTIRDAVERAQEGQSNAHSVTGFTAASSALEAIQGLARSIAKGTRDPRKFLDACGLQGTRI